MTCSRPGRSASQPKKHQQSLGHGNHSRADCSAAITRQPAVRGKHQDRRGRRGSDKPIGMPDVTPTVVFVDDHSREVEPYINELQNRGIGTLFLDASSSRTVDRALAYIERHPVELVVCDLLMELPSHFEGPVRNSDLSFGFEAGEVFASIVRASKLDMKIAIFSQQPSQDIAVQRIKRQPGFWFFHKDKERLTPNALATQIEAILTPQTSTPQDFSGLSKRQLEVLYYMCQGWSYKLIADKLGLKEPTVRQDYATQLRRHFSASSRAELQAELSRRGLSVSSPQSEQAVTPFKPANSSKN
jgi:DNA-binding NarL/FixJ family response regulator